MSESMEADKRLLENIVTALTTAENQEEEKQ